MSVITTARWFLTKRYRYHRIDVNESTLRAIVAYAKRLSALLDRADKSRNEDLKATLDDLLGALYSLIAAHENAFHGKTKKSEHSASVARANDVANGYIRTSGNWMAGYHFNN